MIEKILIVGGVAGGMSAATRLRRLNENAEIIVFERGPYVSFANCGLPYYVGGEIAEREKLIVQSAKALKNRFNLEVRENSEVIAIDSEGKKVTVVSNGESYVESYDKLILSPGAKPLIPQIKGLNQATNVFSLRNIPDVDKIMTYLKAKAPKSATIIGAGFIGLEMAENLAKRGLSVTIVEKAPHVLPTIDREMAAFVNEELIKNNLSVMTNRGAVEFKNDEILLDNGESLQSDLTILSVGIQPETSLAKSAGIKLGLRNAILVDEHYETSVKDIYAVGDAIVVKNQLGQDALISLASPANRQGRQVADIISGLPVKNRGSLGTAIVRVFDLQVASTGLSEFQLRGLKINHKIVHVTANNHAGYYPDATSIVLKLIFEPESGQIFGAQAIGKEGVDKRIDILSTAIKAKLTIFDLPELELTYAPPFGSAKDPVNMAGYAAINLLLGQSENIQWHELAAELAKGKVLLDVRNPNELAKGKFKNSQNIPLDDLRERLNELDKKTEYIVSCQSGLRSYNAERILKQEGYKVKNLDGAFGLYSKVTKELLD
ncbi:FAD-dependent oxidoreductase [Lactococcus lactis]|jgi:NADPH-dependent 2,4-dienoyl-CoA reductase/sulfur reductase-like enzyme/rhodanese-related sulfurtransferase|uniref:CoA-disulfide reductase / Polysulfide binding and transferase domain n=1 Tax=Lactococcus lactis subsp. lactis TaxID=1360 RepID=A0A0V8DYH1_LACLL|nr:FAD-dependent oxidoreductase [Lactococcus lactis]KGF76587.1 CoA-disulfide reductase [Lactococcus lactis]KSU04444.1 CoA-disulfide reductase / Polysulfide binding and transferase domain [Lactococcus lactis subsp. lactis]KSU18576.1 CoA-disulfide reductase / Polysulfide binding and transferase domain [Lactococcus lactis subsp. lactis]